MCHQAENCPEPLDIYRYMQAQGIGVIQACLYIAWSEEYENQGNCRKADLVYQEGFKKFAEPRDKLLQFHKYEIPPIKLKIKCIFKMQSIGIITICMILKGFAGTCVQTGDDGAG